MPISASPRATASPTRNGPCVAAAETSRVFGLCSAEIPSFSKACASYCPMPALAPVTRATRAGSVISAGFQALGCVHLFGLRSGEEIHQRLGGDGLLGGHGRTDDIDKVFARPLRQHLREGEYP